MSLIDQQIQELCTKKRRSSGAAHSRTVYKYPVSSLEKRQWLQTCNKPQRGESIPTLPPLQDGGYPSALQCVTAPQLARENRSEGHLFCSSHLGKTSEVPLIRLERDTDGV